MSEELALEGETLMVTKTVVEEFDMKELLKKKALFEMSIASEQARLDEVQTKIDQAVALGYTLPE